MAVHFDFIAMWSSLKDNGHSSYIYIKIPWRVRDHETGLSGWECSFFPTSNIYITLYFNVSSTLLRKNRNTDFLYIYFFSSFVFCCFFHLLNWGKARVITSLMYNLIYFSCILHHSNDVKNKNTVDVLLTDTLNSDPVFLFSCYLTLHKMGMPSLKDGYLVPFPKV